MSTPDPHASPTHIHREREGGDYAMAPQSVVLVSPCDVPPWTCDDVDLMGQSLISEDSVLPFIFTFRVFLTKDVPETLENKNTRNPRHC